ncbi:MAG: MotE family protein [Candidatus Brocadia sp.]
MKLPLNKKMMMLPGIGIAVFGISVMGMIFMRGSKSPSAEQIAQTTSQDMKENDGTTLKHIGTSTTGVAKAHKDKKEKLTAKLPSVYKQNATAIFKPLSSNEIASMIKELEKEKNEYEKRKELLDFKEKALESVRADLEAERKELDAIKQELNKILEVVSTQKVELKKETVLLNEVESKNIKKLAAVYSGMKPEKAAMIIKEMDEETAVKLLTMMDGKSSARILESIDLNLAVKLSERLKLLKSDFKNGKK